MDEDYFVYDGDDDGDLYFNGVLSQKSGRSLYEMYNNCLKPIFSNTTWEIAVIFFWCFIFRISTYVTQGMDKLQHTICFALGIICLKSLFSNSFYCIIFLVIFSYMILFVTSYFHYFKQRGFLLVLTSLSFLITCEVWIVDSQMWHRIRGPQMIVAMKAISLAYDLDFGTVQQIPNLIYYSGYMLCPGTCIFGPWTTYNDYLSIFKRPNSNFKWLQKVITSLALAYFFLSISTCWANFFITDNSDEWLITYRNALSFRTSHYFVSYISESTSVLTGFDATGFSKGHVSVTHPLNIELPRSIISVVTNWNVPMHHWLKVYIFATNRRVGNFFAILATYIVSSLLHGLNFQLAAVLMSIGVYSYGEFMLRKNLASMFSSCVLARRCRLNCPHLFKKNHPVVILANVIFSSITVIQLAYLGNVFDSGNQEEIGYSYDHTVKKWSELNFLGHYMTLMFYFLYIYVKYCYFF